jgi:putative tributyrin esterase
MVRENVRLRRAAAWLGLAAILFAGNALGQAPSAEAPSRIETVEFDSTLMARRMPFRVVVPARYNEKAEAARRYPVVYLLHGLFGGYDNWTKLTKLAEYSAAADVIIVTPEGKNGWYTDSAANPSDKFESHIVREVIPEVDKRYRTIAERRARAIGGLSMGGYGAVKLGLKFPEMFILAGSFSGALGAASISEKTFPGAIGKTIDGIMGPVDSEARRSNDPFELIRRTTPEKLGGLPFIYFDCGTEDFLFQNNREFADLLVQKKVPHEFRQLPGGHDWKYWDRQVKEFLAVAIRSF